jgi:hypothetical protein
MIGCVSTTTGASQVIDASPGISDYTISFLATLPPREVIERISDVPGWWGADYQGSAAEIGDVFTVRFSNGDRYTLRVAELERWQRVIWQVVDARQEWVSDPSEWVGTSVVWTVEPGDGATQVRMRHVGLTPQLECFERCSWGWGYLVNESLAELLAGRPGRPA